MDGGVMCSILGRTDDVWRLCSAQGWRAVQRNPKQYVLVDGKPEEVTMDNRLKNLGKYAHKPKTVDVGRSEDDMSAGKARVNTKQVPNKMPSKTPKSGGGVRG